MGSLPLFLGGGLLAAAVVLFILTPVIKGQRALLHRTDEEFTEDEFRRKVALSALRDVEYDYATGKLDDEDYKRLKGELSVEALRILEHSDQAVVGRRPAGAPGPEGGVDAVEREIARIRKGLEEGRTCRTCAYVNPIGSRFCGRCGRPLKEEKSQTVPAREGS